MRTRYRYVDLKVTKSVWSLNQPFVVLFADGKQPSKALKNWTPHRYKSVWKLRVTNSSTKKTRVHTLTEVKHIYGWLIVCWNPNEALDAVMGILPIVMGTTALVGALGTLQKGKLGETEKGD